MARQIISSLNAPARLTPRQQAFNQGLEQMAQGFGALQDQEMTKRQQAFNESQKLASLGLDVTPEQVYQERFEGVTPESGSYLTKISDLTRQREDDAATLRENERLRREQAKAQEFEQQKQLIGMRGQQQQDLAQMRMAQQQQKTQADEQKKMVAQQKARKEFEVPGFGEMRTKKEAQEIRSSLAEAEEAKKIIDQIKTLGKDVSIFDRGRVEKINSLKSILAGKLRLPLTGPGAMTEDEYQRLVKNMGDPTDLLSTEAIEFGKLDQLRGILDQSVKSKIAAASATPNQVYQSPQQPGQINVPFNPIQNPQIMGEAMAGEQAAREQAGQMDRNALLNFLRGQ